MDAGNWVAVVVGLAGVGFGFYTHATNRTDQQRRDRLAREREDGGIWLRGKQAAYAALLAAEFAFLDELSNEARGITDNPTPTIDRTTTDKLFAEVVAAQGVVDLLAPQAVRDAVRQSIAALRTFGWSVRDRQREEINPERRAALDRVETLNELMRADLGVEPSGSTPEGRRHP